MNETMLDCYLSQFRTMERIIQNRNELLSEFVDFFQKKSPARIYLVGSGSSYNACSAAAFFMGKVLGIEVTVTAPSTVSGFFGQNPLVIAVSQSGRSTNTLRAIDLAHQQGVPTVSLTDPKETPVGKQSDLAVALRAENEIVGPKTRGYTATILTLHLMALEAAYAMKTITEKEYDSILSGYQSIYIHADSYIKACSVFYDHHFDSLKEAKYYIFSGKEADAMTARECALKVLETICYPAFSYEFEELLHGPLCCATESLGLFLFLPSDEDQSRVLKTADIIGKITKNCYIITDDPSVQGQNILNLPENHIPSTRALTYILIGQLISARLTEDMSRKRHAGVQAIFDEMGIKKPRTN